MSKTAMATLVEGRSILVCCGSGGVGKTTTAAALAVEGARRGRRTCVVTIDPAKRLADALGEGSLGGTPRQVHGDWPGELWAVMLDTESTFDGLVRRYAATPRQAEDILGNRLYRNVAAALSGTQEYMAMEKLYELSHGEGQEDQTFDLIVVDTPPTRNALDFIEAPARLSRLLENRVFRLLVMPTRASLRVVSSATQGFLRAVSKAVGADVVTDVVAFFKAFEGMEEGFRDRAGRVRKALESDDTAFVLVTTPQRTALEETAFFARELERSGLRVDSLVVNRLHPRFGDEGEVRLTEEPAGPLAPFYENLADLRRIARREEASFAVLADRVAPAAVVRVPFLSTDVHDLDGLTRVGRHLVGSEAVESPAVRSPGSAPTVE